MYSISTDQLLNGVASRLIYKGSPCDSYPCWNEGSCLINNHTNSYICHCIDSFIGDQCQYKISSLCLIANCSYSYESCSFNGLIFSCINHIQDLFSSCTSSPCANGGSCEEREGTHRCQCPHPYTGPLCQYEIQNGTNLDWNTIEISLVLLLFFLVLFVFLLICCSGNIGFYVYVPSKRYSRWEDGENSDEDDDDIAMNNIKRSDMRISQTAETLLEGDERTNDDIVHL